MSSRAWWLAAFAGLLIACPVRAEERHVDFLNALREAQLYDQAMLFLDQLELRTDLDPALKEVLELEKGMTLLESERVLTVAAEQLKALDGATVHLQKFLQANPNHPRAANCSFDLAQVLVRKGKVEIAQSKRPENKGKKGEFQARARGYFTEARKTFQQASELYEARIKELGKTFIDPQKDPKKHAEREEAIANQVQAEFQVNLCNYEETLTYDPEDPKRKPLLEKTAIDFEKLHQKHRSVVAGLYARLYQGKCYEEMGDLTKALGIYNELLGHGQEDTDEVLERLKDHAMLFKLISLNDPKKNDWQVVVDLATEWSKERGGNAARTTTGIGIRFQKARALEQLGLKAFDQRERAAAKKTEKPKKSKEKPEEEAEPLVPDTVLGSPDALLSQAEAEARYVARAPGEYRDASLAMIQRIRAFLGKSSGDPKDWDTAFGLLRPKLQGLKTKRDAILKAAPEEKAKLQAEYEAMVKESIRLLKLTMSLNNPVAPDKEAERDTQLNQVRYFLAYAYFSHPNKSYTYDGALVSEYVARKHPKTAAALESAFLAIYCWQVAYAQTETSKRALADPLKAAAEVRASYEIQRCIGICEYIIQQWPTDDKAQDARLRLGELYSQIRQPVKAAEAFQSVPKDTPQYLDAQLNAGTALWDAYLTNAFLPEADRAKKEEVDSWPGKAKTILETAIKEQEAKLQTDTQSEPLTRAKLSLMQVLNFTLDHATAIKLLTDGKYSVLAGVEKLTGKQGDMLRTFARREALRAYVGLNQVEKAREQLKELEKISGGGDGLTRILVDLGRKLKEEIDQKAQADDPRLIEVLKSFEAFLGDLFVRKEGQDYNSLSWIGQTYFSLGEGIEKKDPARAVTYFEKSGEAYQLILTMGQADEKFMPPNARNGIQLRKVMSLRRQKKFDEAHALVLEILKANAALPDVQTEAAMIYEDRATQGGPTDWKYWEKAIMGDIPENKSQPKLVWGWIDFGIKLRDTLYNSSQNLDVKKKTDLENKFFDVRHRLARARLMYARAHSSDSEKERFLSGAIQDLTLTSQQVRGFGERPDYDRLNALYKEVRQELNDVLGRLGKNAEVVPVADLNRNAYTKPAEQPEEVAVEDKKPTKAADASETPTEAKPAAEKKAEGTDMTTIMIGLGVVLVIGAGMVVMVMRQPKKKRRSFASSPELEPSGPVPAPAPATPKSATPPPPKKTARTKAP